jgi:hypothetical protein
MHSESQIVGDLRSALDDEVENLRAQPGAAQRARTRARRRRAARGLLVGVPTVALATGLVIAAQSSTPGPTTSATGTSTRSAGPTTSNPQVETAAYITKHVEAALANADHYIIRETTQSYSGGIYTGWTDPRTGSSYAAQGAGSGKVLSWNSTFYVNDVLHWRTTEADYSSHTWFVSVIHAAGPIQGAPPNGPDVPGGSPAQLKKGLADGTMRVVGHGYVNGHHATELRASLGVITLEVWVDSHTYQPVREVKSFGGGLNDVLVFNDSWIPRTPALVSLANHPQIPAGFTRVPAPR